MTWKPEKEKLTDFVFRFSQLANELGYSDEQQISHFVLCIPRGLYLYLKGAQTIPDAVDNLRRDIAIGVLDVFNSNPTIVQDDSKPTPSNIITQLTTDDTLRAVKESIKDSMYDNNKTQGLLLDEIVDRLANVVEDFESEHSSRDRDRDRSHSRGRNNLRDDYKNRNRNRDRYRDDSRDHSTDNYRDRNRGKSNSRYGRSERRKHQRSGTGQRNFDRNEFCNYCDITGHITHRCFKLADYLKGKGKKIISHEKEEVQRASTSSAKLELKTQQPEGQKLNKLLKDSLSIRGNPEICPKPCPSVSYNVNPIEIFGSQIDKTITCNEKIQPVESQEILEVESNKLNESDIDPFEIDYSFETLYGKIDEENCYKMMKGNDQINTLLFCDKGVLNEDWHKYTCT